MGEGCDVCDGATDAMSATFAIDATVRWVILCDGCDGETDAIWRQGDGCETCDSCDSCETCDGCEVCDGAVFATDAMVAMVRLVRWVSDGAIARLSPNKESQVRFATRIPRYALLGTFASLQLSLCYSPEHRTKNIEYQTPNTKQI